ncbi:MAG: hypothetical protein M3R36_10115 [Bacteroidota bacterium]|nr:hypothetical protein [Bacteroidota bacterium]
MEEALQYTQLITNIIIILLFIGLVILVFKLIKQIKKITEKVEAFSNDFNDIKPKIFETLDKVKSISDNVNKVITKVNQNVDILGTIVDKVKDTAESIIDFEKKIQSRIEPPVMDTVKTISGISAGVKTFIEVWKNKKKNKVNSAYSSEKFDEMTYSMDEVNKELEEVNLKLSDLQK